MTARAWGEETTTVFNQHTNRPDYITKLSSSTLPPGSTNYIRNTSTLQSGATFHVSSGTVSGQFSPTTIRWPDGTVQVSSPPASSGGGDITGVTAGYGLLGGGSSGEVTLSLNANTTSYIQNTSNIQSGATFYTSSGTALNFNASTVAITNIVSISTSAASLTNLTIQASSENYKALVILQKSTSQSANLTEWQNSTGSVRAMITEKGNFSDRRGTGINDGIEAFGYGTLVNLTSGTFNTAVGGTALANCTYGSYNAGLGGATLQGLVGGSFDLGFGHGVLSGLINGNFNTGVGGAAGQVPVTSSGVTLLGAATETSASGSNECTSLGYNAVCSDNQLAVSPYHNRLTMTALNDVSATRERGELFTEWIDNTDATRKARTILRTYDTAARDGVVIDSDGNRASVSVIPGTSTIKAKVGGTIYFSTTTANNSGAGETNLWSQPIAANTLTEIGDRLYFYHTGTIQTSLNNKRLRVKFGATTFYDSTAQNPAVATNFVIHGMVMRTGATSQKCSAELSTSGGSLFIFTGYSTAAETLSGAVTLVLTGQGGASNEITFEAGFIKWESSS